MEKEPIEKRLSKAIKKSRKEFHGISQKELADRIGIRQSAVSRVEVAKTGLTTDLMMKICDALGIEVEFKQTIHTDLDKSCQLLKK